MFADNGQHKPSQVCFTSFVIQMALEQIKTLSDCLIAIEASDYEVEKDTIANLDFLIREKTQNIKNFMEEMSKENRSIVVGGRLTEK